MDDPLVCGIYTWTRGGGWHGPYPKNEFWCDLNAYVIAHYAADPSRTELEIFNEYAAKVMGLSEADLPIWRKLCLTAGDALLHGRCVEAFDRHYAEGTSPCFNWMRDDLLGGMIQLREVFDYLWEHDLLDAALVEKRTGCLLWQETARLFEQITVPDAELSAFIKTSIEYAIRLFEVIYCGWEAMIEGYKVERTGNTKSVALKAAIHAYDQAWDHYQALADDPYASTLYRDFYREAPGMGHSIQQLRELCS